MNYWSLKTALIFASMFVFIVPNHSLAGSGSAETVFFLSDDLKTATEYKNMRQDIVYKKNSMNFPFSFNKSNVMYARPSNYSWGVNTFKGEKYQQLTFHSTSNYAYLQKYDSTNAILNTVSDNHYRLSVDGTTCMGEGCYQDENIISVVFPKKFKITKYSANVKGEWKIVDNTYTFYSKYIPGAEAFFEFEDTVPKVYVDLAQVLAKFDNIKVSYDGNNVHVVMPVEGVFNSGDTTIQKNGEHWIKIFGETLKKGGMQELRVEGHSDSSPIKSKVFPSNWELSSARSAAVVRYLIGLGLDSKMLASVGYADSRPIADNKSTEGKRKNRRIEFTIVPKVFTVADASKIDMAPE